MVYLILNLFIHIGYLQLLFHETLCAAIVFRLENNVVIGYTLLYNTTVLAVEETGARALPVHISSMYLRALDQAIRMCKLI